MNQLSDELFQDFSQGSPHAFNAIFDSFRMRIYYFVKKLIDDAATAEEITSDTFVKLYRLHNKFNTYNNIQAFLFITARNASLDFLKYHQRQREHMTELKQHEEQEADTDLPLFAETDIQAEVLQFIYEEIQKLPPRSKDVVLYSLEGLTIKEIAEKMGISVQTVANQKTTAIKALRMKVLDKPWGLCWLLFLLGEKGY